MITITKQEQIILDELKYFQQEYPNGISENILKSETNITEHQFKDILKDLTRKKLIKIENNKLKLIGTEKKINVVKNRQEVKTAELNQMEIDALNILNEMSDDEFTVSKYMAEGTLLYGDLKLSNPRMYHILVSLQNKEILKKIEKEDGEYYQINM
jgi:hypothetical protein